MKKITLGNKLIAEFSGIEWIGEDHVYDKYTDMAVKDEFGLSIAQYHDNWEWLMPVIYKFLSLEDFSDPDKSLELKRVKAAISGLGIATPIDTVWNHLVNSIIWYNSVK